jgi:hypothetical protein
MAINVLTTADVEALASLRFSKHALFRMLELQIEPIDVMLTIARPEQSWTQTRNGRAVLVMQRGDVGLVWDPGNRTVITVLLRTKARWEHGEHTVQAMPAHP